MEKMNLDRVFLGFYVEDLNHQMPPRLLDNKTYALAMESFVVVCTDAILANRQKGIVYLAYRRVKPMQGWWIIGGKSFAGETPKDSIQRCFKRETSLELPKERFALIGLNRYFWKDRKQEPQNVGSDNLAYTFIVEPTPDEIVIVSQSLDPQEYDRNIGLQKFNLERLISKNVHPVILDLYQQIFSS